MEKVNPPVFVIKYNQKDITTDVTPYLHSLTYKDSAHGRCDEIEMDLSNVDGKWSDEWYPAFGDTLTVTMGYGTLQFPCGTFEIDECEQRFGPDIFSIRGVAAGIKNAVRTEVSTTHENKTLHQIAQAVCKKHGFKLQGITGTQDGFHIHSSNTIRRVTQNRETDLAFLFRIAKSYGYVFSLRDKVLTFTDVYDLEKLPSATTIFYEDFIPGACSIKDKSWETYKKVNLSYHNPRSRSVETVDFTFDDEKNIDGYGKSVVVKSDVKEIRIKANNGNEALRKAKAALHSSNSKQQEAVLSIRGNPLMVAGNNVIIAGIGKLSGTYHIMSSTHRINPESGYITSVTAKRVGYIDLVSAKRKKKKVYKNAVVIK